MQTKVLLCLILHWRKEKKLSILVIEELSQVIGKEKVILKLTSDKTLVLNEMLHVFNFRTNLISVGLLGNIGVKMSFKFEKVVRTKTSVFVEKKVIINMVYLCLMFLES